jgi:hypothetical protein
VVRVSNASGERARGLAGHRGLVVAAGLLTIALGAAAGFTWAVAGSEALRGALMERSGATSARGAVRAVAMAPVHLLRAVASDVPVRHLNLDVKFKYLHEIYEKRDEALRTGVLSTSDDDFVPASIDVSGRTVPVKLRLAGDRPDLLEGEKWPLRVRARGDGHLFGMRRFVLQAPWVQGFQAESLFLEHLRREDVLAPRFLFVDLTLNGKDIGLMALEESFSIELLESQQRRDGPMLRFDAPPGGANPGAAAVLPAASAISPLRPGHVARSRKLSRNLKTATNLLRAYLGETLNADDVFDADLMGRYLALAELWGAQHALEWQSLRFYFNPLTARLEPIGHAAELQHPHRGDGFATRTAPFAARLLEDRRIRAAFVRSLHRIAGEMLAPSFSAAMLEQETRQLRLLHREYPLRVAFDAGPVLERAARLLRVDAASAMAESEGARTDEAVRATNPALPLPTVSLAETLARHPFLAWDEASGELRAPAGRWDVQGSLILPRGAGLTLPAGTVLRFQPRHGLIARGPLVFLGEKAAPVVLEGPAGEKKSQLWSGVYVVESERPSRWSHVVIRNAGGFKRHGWMLTGGVVFRKTRVDLDHCAFTGDRTDDALNIVRSAFSLRDVTIVEPRSDGFDGDYVEGTIVGGFISRAGGDGIDLGGSRVTVRGTRLLDIRDKAISVGERSQLSARDIQIEHAGIGLASKNGSEVTIADSTLSDISDVALVAYMNRPEFGRGSLTAENNRITRAALPALAQTGSRVLIDGTVLAPVDAAIDRLHKERDAEP